MLCDSAMSRGGRGRGRGGRGSASAELLRDVGEDLGGSANFQAEDEPPPKWPAMVLPSPQIPSPEEIASIGEVAPRERFYDWCAGKQRDARKKMRESSVFAELNKDDKDIEPLLSAMGLTRAQAVSEYAAFTAGLLHLVLQHRLN